MGFFTDLFETLAAIIIAGPIILMTLLIIIGLPVLVCTFLVKIIIEGIKLIW